MEQKKEIYELVGKWLDGNTTPAEEKILKDYFSSASSLPEDLEPYRIMFCGLGSISEDCAPPAVLRRSGFWRKPWIYLAAASVAIGIVVAAYSFRTPYCYVNGKPVYDKELAHNAADRELRDLKLVTEMAKDLTAICDMKFTEIIDNEK